MRPLIEPKGHKHVDRRKGVWVLVWVWGQMVTPVRQKEGLLFITSTFITLQAMQYLLYTTKLLYKVQKNEAREPGCGWCGSTNYQTLRT